MSDIEAQTREMLQAVSEAGDMAALESVRIAVLGKKGTLTELMKGLGAMSADERKLMGPALNGAKDQLTAAIAARSQALHAQALDARLAQERIDVTLPARPEIRGAIHPVSQVIDEVIAIFGDMGFSVAEGPDIESDFYNFTALNIPPEHPARQMHDTFYFNEKPGGERLLLRTHTSPVQIRTMEKSKPPLRIIAPGRTYRCDSDMTHTPMFHQVEGLVIDETAHMGHLKGCLIEFCKAFFEVDNIRMRFRPSHFPFTEPSAEVDIGCRRSGGELRIGEGDDWLEILGCGMVHPKVLRHGGIDPDKYQGFAFGMGIDRLAMLKYGIPDLRDFFEADLRWLRHYGFAALDIPSLVGGIEPMKFTLSWLREHLDTTASTNEISERLTSIGLEVEAVQDRAAALASFTVAKIISAEQHPNADRLRLCMVDTGREQVQVVCGAPNARAGLRVVFAPTGATIPSNGMVLKTSKIRGADSNGMLCSASELGLSDDHEGIIELAPDAPIGAPIAGVMGLNDPMIDVSITPNRPDCLGVHGIARDLAASGMGMLKSGAVEAVSGNGPCTVDIGLHFEGVASPACPMFAGRLVTGVKNGPSPDWLRQRLEAIGLRSISTLVDITNYISFDRGRPLHVYDASTLRGQIHARLGRPGEKLHALDGREYAVDAADCVIADDSGVLGFGGVIGGMASGCTDATVNVFIESAYFDPLRIAATGRRHSIDSDARYRFERGVDPQFVLPGLELATRMILKLCGGVASDVRVAGAAPALPDSIEFRPQHVRALTGMEVADAECVRILDALGFAVEADTSPMAVRAPSWRPDIHGETDLVEEIARINGFDKLPATPLPRMQPVTGVAVNTAQNRVRWTKRLLAGRGMMEAVTWSFLSARMAELFGGGGPELTLANPISTELSVMRPSLLPNLLAAAKRNADRGQADISLFEVGPQYAGDAPQDQTTGASGVRCAQAVARHWAVPERAVDVFDVKADVWAVLEQLGAPMDKLRVTADAPNWYHPGRSGVVRLGPKNALATFGEVHPAILDALDMRGPVMAFEIVLDNIPLPKAHNGASRGTLRAPDLQPVSRDFAFIVDSGIAADQVLRAAASSAPELITGVTLFDLFEGERIGAGRKSLAISVTLQPREKTLTDKEIDAAAEAIIQAVKKATGGELRG